MRQSEPLIVTQLLERAEFDAQIKSLEDRLGQARADHFHVAATVRLIDPTVLDRLASVHHGAMRSLGRSDLFALCRAALEAAVGPLDIRRFLVHVLPKAFPRIRHYGLLATGRCKANIARGRELLAALAPAGAPKPASSDERRIPSPCRGGRMLVIGSFEGTNAVRAPPQHRWRAG